MSVKETLELDLRGALTAVQSLDKAFTSTTARFSTGVAQALAQLDTTIAVEADVTGVTAAVDEAIQSEETIAVDADVSGAEAEIGSLEAEPVTVEVDADTTDAQAAIDDLGSSASTASVEVGKLGDSAGLLGGSAALAAGQVGGLSQLAEGIGGSAARGAIGIGAVSATIGVLVKNGIEATSALQRFDVIVGEMADQVLRVKVGDLNVDLDKLAIKLGTDDEALRNASATLFQFARNSGASKTAAATFTNQVDALAARAVALNPALGSVADAAETLSVRLSRGGRFAAAFGLSLTADEINVRALANTTKLSADQLTIFEKSQAAAQIAVERYGNTLNTTVANGAKNAEIQQRSLREQLNNVLEAAGKPLVAPFLDAFKNAIPVITAFATSIGQLAGAILPALAPILQAITPILTVFADVLSGLPPVVLSVGTAIVIASVAIHASIPEFVILASVVTAASFAMRAFGLGGAKDATKALNDFQAAARALSGLGTAALLPALDGLARKFADLSKEAGSVQGSGAVNRLAAFREIAEQSLGTAARLASQVDKTSGEYRAMQTILGQVAGAQAQANKDSEVSADILSDQGDAYDRAAAAADGFKDSLDRLLGIHVSALQAEIDLKTAIADTTETLKEAKDGTDDWSGSLDSNTVKGRENLESVLNSVSAALEFSDALVRETGSVEKGREALVGFTRGLREQLIAAGNAPEVVDTILRRIGLLGTDFGAAGTGLGSALGTGLAAGIDNSIPLITSAARDAAAAADEAVRAELGIFSPSKVFMGLGASVAEGFAIGIDKGTERFVTKAGKKLAMRVAIPSVGANGQALVVGGGSSAVAIDLGVSVDLAKGEVTATATRDGKTLAVRRQNIRSDVRGL